MMLLSFLLVCVLAGSFGLTAWLRSYALKKSLMDIPNHRSSHSVPTPRGGGVAIVVSYLLAVVIMVLLGVMDSLTAVALLGAGSAIALLGLLDDLGHVAARWRLLVHFLGAIWVVVFLGGLPPLIFITAPIDLGWLGHLLAVVYLVWLLNLYNFMDGIDGLAGIEAVSVCLGAALLAVLSGYEGYATLVLAFACLGFLVWNFPRARIFMGDAGSGFVGLSLGVLSLQAAHWDSRLFWAWVILLAVFVTDATVTLFNRLARGEKIYQAHRSHAYQYVSRRYGKHWPVTLSVALINLFWLFPLSWGVVIGVMPVWCGLLTAYVPLVILAICFKAGNSQSQGRLA